MCNCLVDSFESRVARRKALASFVQFVSRYRSRHLLQPARFRGIRSPDWVFGMDNGEVNQESLSTARADAILSFVHIQINNNQSPLWITTITINPHGEKK
ncbi:MAG: hypothetical protein KatS3mg105_4678 [Gemmatales bacterium]|nr:MAG: hypothetical protein KatS3mg105_4678 [Gemmatales bacterium]